jgi:hypothetical protein
MTVVIGTIAGFALGFVSAWAIRKGMDQDRGPCSTIPIGKISSCPSGDPVGNGDSSKLLKTVETV